MAAPKVHPEPTFEWRENAAEAPLNWAQVMEDEFLKAPGELGAEAQAQILAARQAFEARWEESARGKADCRDLEAMKATKEAEWLKVLHGLSHRRNAAAICLSGGGIRSATFSLGVLQGLAKAGKLSRFDYLSTVSGGGYIGGWFKAWQARNGEVALGGGSDEVVAGLKSELPDEPCAEAEAIRKPLGAGPEARQVRWLRSFSNYLSPRLGVLSADTWTLVSLVLRNLLVHWTVLLPILGALLLLPHLALWVISQPLPLALTRSLFGLACALTLFGFFESWDFTPNPERERSSPPDQGRILLRAVVPLAVAAFLFTLLAGSSHASWNLDPNGARWGWIAFMPWHFAALMGAFHFLGWLIHTLLRGQMGFWCLLREAMMSLLLGVLGGWGAAKLLGVLFPTSFQVVELARYVVLAPAALLMIYAVGGCFLMALGTGLHLRNGRPWLPEGEEEWLARFWAWLLIFGCSWGILSAIPLLGPFVLQKAWSALAISGVGVFGLINCLMAGRTGEGHGEKGSGLKGWLLSRGATLGGTAFCLALLFLLSLGLSAGLVKLRRHEHPHAHVQASTVATFQVGVDLQAPVQNLSLTRVDAPKTLTWLERMIRLHRGAMAGDSRHASFLPLRGWALGIALPLGVAIFLALLADLSRFSGQGLYTRRLIRAYLGASHLKRRPDPFTGFDPFDDFQVSELGNPLPDSGLRAAPRPFPVLNLTMNLVGGDRLAWQERKAERFTVSPLHCGSRYLGFRDSARYGGGITLGTAVGLSGAAVNSNMGYHTSRVVAFLTTFFNIRLGAWLGNPGPAGHRTWHKPHPRFYPWLLLKEATGLTDKHHPWVNLSDGGHFENLGLYEMVARRCRLILVVDAGADGGFTDEDLGLALRKIRIDFGIPVSFAKPINPGTPLRMAVGTIQYSEVDRDEAGNPAKDGLLVYLKAAMLDDEPADVAAYAQANEAFPHESTADQFFSESQFESYRRLGEFTVASALPQLP